MAMEGSTVCERYELSKDESVNNQSSMSGKSRILYSISFRHNQAVLCSEIVLASLVSRHFHRGLTRELGAPFCGQ